MAPQAVTPEKIAPLDQRPSPKFNHSSRSRMCSHLQKGPMGLFVRTIGIARARVKIGLATLAYNMRRFVFLTGKCAAA